eukprot:TRINITY_DN3680_c0_g1_i2.p1 TRINITY_DN3680_c0_g1~~TRINITY_DN3680_c0_g1_i2.p1  ORF type:complete len:133 (-),score=17.98 TRINITY_DN3680_c0_g1_i2:27-425(-)
MGFIISISNNFTGDEATMQVIRELRKKRYSIYLMSNIGGFYFEDMFQQMPQFFEENFDGYYTSSEADGYLKKPNSEYYDVFQSRYNIQQKQVIFIDDKRNNCIGALQSNSGNKFYPYHFISTKQFVQEFQVF